MKKSTVVLMLSMAWVLAACGGGDDDAPPATDGVPPGATTSDVEFISYLKRLVVAPGDTLEPIDVSAVEPPASETAEPEAVE